MTVIYALVGWERSGDARTLVRHYFTTDQAARDALPDLVLDGRLDTPCKVEVIELHGPDLGDGGIDDAVGKLLDLRRGLYDVLGIDEGVAVPDEGLLRDVREQVRLARTLGQPVPAGAPAPAGLHERPEDAEYERRRRAVEVAAIEVVDSWLSAPVPWRVPLRDAVDALREYAPADVIASAGEGLAEQGAPVTASVRDELHALAPLPWSRRGDNIFDARGCFVGDVATMPQVVRVAALLVQLVNGPDVEVVDQAQDDRHRAERAVLDAAREVEAARGDAALGAAAHRVRMALHALDALPGGGVA